MSTLVSADKYSDLPPIVIATRTRTTVNIHNIPNTIECKNSTVIDNDNKLPPTFPSSHHSHASTHIQPTKQLWCSISLNSIELYNRKYKLIGKIQRSNVSSVSFSKSCRYLCTWQAKSTAATPDNLLVYDLTQLYDAHGILLNNNEYKSSDDDDIIIINEPRYKYVCKLEIKWHEHPPIQFCSHDTIMCYNNNNNIYIYNLNDNTNRYQAQLHLDHLSTYSVCDTQSIDSTQPLSTHLVTFQSQHAAIPAKLSIYNINDINTVMASKQFFKAEEALIKWSTNGEYILVQSATFTDKTGKSYYGESQLHCISVSGTLCTTVQFNQSGPIQDFQWNPLLQHCTEFIVIQGFQPAKAILYTIKNNDIIPLRDYGTAARNTIVWSSHGRYVMLGGFGNLAGEMDYWDNLKFKKLGTIQDDDGAKLYQWTPDSRYLITAALRPWRNVDNGYKIYTYAGELIIHQKYDELWQLCIQPAGINTQYPSRPPSPRLSAARQSARLQPQNIQSSTRSAYVPPHLRGKQNGNTTTNPAANIFKHPVSTPKKLNTVSSQQSANNKQQQPVVQKQLSLEEELHQQQKQLHKQLKQIADIKSRVDRGLSLSEKQNELLHNETKLNQQLHDITEQLKNMF